MDVKTIGLFYDEEDAVPEGPQGPLPMLVQQAESCRKPALQCAPIAEAGGGGCG